MESRRYKNRQTRAAWISVARRALIQGGIEQVKINRLAQQMGITRGSFYWFFSSHQELLDALLHDWETSNTQSMLNTLNIQENDGPARFRALMTLWIEEKTFDPRYDSAIRDWARTSRRVANAVRMNDDRRIAAIKEIFLAFGYQPDEAFIRARVTYFHQVGYYALHIRESRARRLKWSGHYYETLTGFKM